MRRWKKRSLAKFGDPNMVRKLFPDVSVSRPGFKFIFNLMAFIFLATAVCGPLISARMMG